jgi:hypothetical protein
MSMRVVHPFGLVPPAVGIASKPLPRAIARISYNRSLLLAVIRRFLLAVPGCYVFAAVVETPGFLRPRPGSLAVFRWMISGGSGDWSPNSPDH